jgi:hypothetical protein
MTPRLTGKIRVSTINEWIRQEDGSFVCGNVRVSNVGRNGIGREEWAIHVFDRGGWVEILPPSRKSRYFSAGSAKIGAAHMTRFRQKKGIHDGESTGVPTAGVADDHPGGP